VTPSRDKFIFGTTFREIAIPPGFKPVCAKVADPSTVYWEHCVEQL
jgi:hypothetical protein